MATGFTTYTCETMEDGEWVALYSTQDPVDAGRWLAKAKADGVQARVVESDE